MQPNSPTTADIKKAFKTLSKKSKPEILMSVIAVASQKKQAMLDAHLDLIDKDYEDTIREIEEKSDVKIIVDSLANGAKIYYLTRPNQLRATLHLSRKETH